MPGVWRPTTDVVGGAISRSSGADRLMEFLISSVEFC
jgi:hypothetical protein